MHGLDALAPEDLLVMDNPGPTDPIRGDPHRSVVVAARSGRSDGYQAGAAGYHAQHHLVTSATEDLLVMGDARPGDSIRRSPHRCVDVEADRLGSDRHEARPAYDHAVDHLVAVAAEDPVFVGNPRPGKPIDRGPDGRIDVEASQVRTVCSYGYQAGAAGYQAAHGLVVVSAEHRLIVWDPGPRDPVGGRPYAASGSPSESSAPTATKPGPPDVTLRIDWSPSRPRTASSRATRDQLSEETSTGGLVAIGAGGAVVEVCAILSPVPSQAATTSAITTRRYGLLTIDNVSSRDTDCLMERCRSDPSGLSVNWRRGTSEYRRPHSVALACSSGRVLADPSHAEQEGACVVRQHPLHSVPLKAEVGEVHAERVHYVRVAETSEAFEFDLDTDILREKDPVSQPFSDQPGHTVRPDLV